MLSHGSVDFSRGICSIFGMCGNYYFSQYEVTCLNLVWKFLVVVSCLRTWLFEKTAKAIPFIFSFLKPLRRWIYSFWSIVCCVGGRDNSTGTKGYPLVTSLPFAVICSKGTNTFTGPGSGSDSLV